MPNPTPSPRRLLWLTLLAGACSADKAGPAAGDSGAEEPKVFGESLHAGWNIIEPGGDTRCARDTPFVFAVRPGRSYALRVTAPSSVRQSVAVPVDERVQDAVNGVRVVLG